MPCLRRDPNFAEKVDKSKKRKTLEKHRFKNSAGRGSGQKAITSSRFLLFSWRQLGLSPLPYNLTNYMAVPANERKAEACWPALYGEAAEAYCKDRKDPR